MEEEKVAKPTLTSFEMKKLMAKEMHTTATKSKKAREEKKKEVNVTNSPTERQKRRILENGVTYGRPVPTK